MEDFEMITLDTVINKKVEWLWYPFIAYGKITIIQGDPGDGKSTFVLNVAAKLSKGIGIDEDMHVSEPINVIYQTAEDGLADTVKPRLEQAGADCSKISIINEDKKVLSMDDERIEKAIKQTGAKLLILDPIQAYLGSGTDINRANETRSMTKKLGAIAEKTGCAVILIGHMNKASGLKATYRGMGSVDFLAVARSVLLIGRIQGQPTKRALIQIKNNLEAFGHSKSFELVNGEFHWLGDYDITAEEVLGSLVPASSKSEIAKNILIDIFKIEKEVLSNHVFDIAKEENISKRTLDSVKKEMNIKSKKKNNEWYWYID